MVTSRPATSRSCFRAGMAPRYDRKTPAQRKRALERRSCIGAAPASPALAAGSNGAHRYMTGVLAGVRLLPIASVLLGSAARGWPRALVLQGEADLLALDLGVQDLVLKVIGGELLEEDARALVLDHLVVLGRGLHDRQLERGLAVGHRLRRDLEAALRHR